jgi:VIT1/CCC1 family predicted Fe2+/Mn2+ transporter
MAALASHEDHRSVSGGLARASVFGINDGLVSNVSLILGFAASGVDSTIVRLAGLAGAVAGAISMAAGEWVSISAQNDLVRRELDIELRELQHNTEHETAELAAIYEGHGMEPSSAAQAAAEVMRSPSDALAVHAREEFGVDPGSLPSALQASVPYCPSFLGSLGQELPQPSRRLPLAPPQPALSVPWLENLPNVLSHGRRSAKSSSCSSPAVRPTSSARYLASR